MTNEQVVDVMGRLISASLNDDALVLGVGAPDNREWIVCERGPQRGDTIQVTPLVLLLSAVAFAQLLLPPNCIRTPNGDIIIQGVPPAEPPMLMGPRGEA